MTNYHPDVQRAYDAHCADGYVVPDDETGPQEATGATESDVPRVQAHVPQEDEGVETKAARVLWETSRRDEGTISATGADIAARALADAGLLVSEDARGALDETLDDLTRTLARAEKAEAEVARYRRLVSWHERHGSDAEARAAELEAAWREACEVAGKGADRKAEVEAVRDRARDAAAALEAENARLTAKVERVGDVLRYFGDGSEFARKIHRALSETTGEAS